MEVKKIYSTDHKDWENVVNFLIQFTLRFAKYEIPRGENGDSKNLREKEKKGKSS